MSTSPQVLAMIERITDAATESPVFSLAQLVKTSVRMKDGKYKNVPIIGGTEFVLIGMREGKRFQFILEFKPIEECAYEQMELLDNQIADVMPDVVSFLTEAIGHRDLNWKDAKTRFVKEWIKQAREAAESIEVGKYEDNPQWGMF